MVMDAGMAIRAKGLTKTFGDRRAVDKVTFDLPAGSFLSIFGPNGAGKTTLLRLLSTADKPSEGQLRVLGLDSKEEVDEIRARIGLISHQSMLYADLTALENLELFGQLYGVEDPRARALELLDAVEMKHRRFDAVGTFSRGMLQRVSIARALVNDPELVLLDEPYSGLDPHAVEVFDRLIARVREGRTFVMVSHDLQKGFSLCTHALILAKGRVVSYQPKDEIAFEEFSATYLQTVGCGVA